MAGGLYWPTQGFPLDFDVRRQLDMDYTQTLVNVNLLLCPMFEVRVVREDDQVFEYVDFPRPAKVLPRCVVDRMCVM